MIFLGKPFSNKQRDGDNVMSQKTSLPRRTFLKGLGTAMGVPFLDAMVSQPLFAAPVKQAMPTRMAFVFFPNGAIMPDWKPTGEGAGYTLSKTLKPLPRPWRNNSNAKTIHRHKSLNWRL